MSSRSQTWLWSFPFSVSVFVGAIVPQLASADTIAFSVNSQGDAREVRVAERRIVWRDGQYDRLAIGVDFLDEAGAHVIAITRLPQLAIKAEELESLILDAGRPKNDYVRLRAKALFWTAMYPEIFPMIASAPAIFAGAPHHDVTLQTTGSTDIEMTRSVTEETLRAIFGPKLQQAQLTYIMDFIGSRATLITQMHSSIPDVTTSCAILITLADQGIASPISLSSTPLSYGGHLAFRTREVQGSIENLCVRLTNGGGCECFNPEYDRSYASLLLLLITGVSRPLALLVVVGSASFVSGVLAGGILQHSWRIRHGIIALGNLLTLVGLSLSIRCVGDNDQRQVPMFFLLYPIVLAALILLILVPL